VSAFHKLAKADTLLEELRVEEEDAKQTAAVKAKFREALKYLEEFERFFQRPHSFDPVPVTMDEADAPSMLNSVCWVGSLRGLHGKVRAACELAVKFASGEANHLDSRGVMRALNGDYPGAIADFMAYLRNAPNTTHLQQRQEWVAALKQRLENPAACRFPLTESVLKDLYDQ
jgi:hypothetical protein